MAGLEVSAATRRFALGKGSVLALDRVGFACRPGAFVAVVGRSGCGKTTLLRAIAGFEQLDSGHIRLVDANPGKRPAMVFQEARLMPWLTVAQNVGFGLIHAPDRDAAAELVARTLELVHLSDFAGAMPDQISGGMAQRAALGRALCLDPELLLMDEPFGALDAFTRRTLQRELIELWRGSLRPRIIVFVTHDVEEAVLLAERVLVMDRGQLIDDVAVDLPYPRLPEDLAIVKIRGRLMGTLLEGASVCAT